MKKPTLIYFKTRGRAEVIRLVLAEAGVEFDEHPVGKDLPRHEGQPTDLAGLREAGLLPFGAVPVWVDSDGFRLAQSGAIARYLAAEHGMMPTAVRELARVEEILGGVDDVRLELRRLVPATPADRPAIVAELTDGFLPRWMGYFDRALAANRDGAGFLVGDSLTLADLALYYLLELLVDNGFGAAIEAHPRLAAFTRRIAERPRIAAYLASPSRWALVRLPR